MTRGDIGFIEEYARHRWNGLEQASKLDSQQAQRSDQYIYRLSFLLKLEAIQHFLFVLI